MTEQILPDWLLAGEPLTDEQFQSWLQRKKQELTITNAPSDGPILPPLFGLVNRKPFTMPLPDDTPIEIPEKWKLPPETPGSAEKDEQDTP
jgi:hypothetical protein